MRQCQSEEPIWNLVFELPVAEEIIYRQFRGFEHVNLNVFYRRYRD